MLLLALVCLAVRAWPGEGGARRAALAGPLVVTVMPVVHFSVLWWRTLHQAPSLLKPSGDIPVDPPMLAALAAGVVAFMLAGVWVVGRRFRALSTLPETSAEREYVARATMRAGVTGAGWAWAGYLLTLTTWGAYVVWSGRRSS